MKPALWKWSQVVKLGAALLLLLLGILIVSTATLPHYEAALTPVSQAPLQPLPGPEINRFAAPNEPPAAQELRSDTPVDGAIAPGPPSAQPPDIQRILQRGYLVVAVLGQDNPPFFWEQSSDGLEGVDIEIARAIAAYLGVELQFNRTAQTFNEVIDQVYSLEADMAISKLSRTLKRARRIRFSQPYVSLGQGFLINRLAFAEYFETVNQEVPILTALNQVAGKIGVLRGSSYVGFVESVVPKGQIVEYDTWKELVQAIIRGEVLAACRDELEIEKVILTQPNAILQMRTVSLNHFKDSIAIALPWDSYHLLSFVNQYLDTTELRYTADSLLNDYTEMLQTGRIPG